MKLHGLWDYEADLYIRLPLLAQLSSSTNSHSHTTKPILQLQITETTKNNTSTSINMKFTVASIIAATAAIASAAPVDTAPVDSQIKDGDRFTVMAIRSGSDLQYASFQAARSGLLLNTAQQNASCGSDVNYATFFLNNGSLFLNTDNPPQQIFVDRSGMGQGAIGYTTGVQSIGKNQERGPFGINDSGELVFHGPGIQGDYGFLACPNTRDGGYSVRLATGGTNPAGLTGCVGIGARALKAENPVVCSYTEGQ
ncbi:hypothetical protein NX059_003184 [Plenodomus lindquistii]|nr:hypothetical protein NX059_003184 [Plenodomus lindquistii]